MQDAQIGRYRGFGLSGSAQGALLSSFTPVMLAVAFCKLLSVGRRVGPWRVQCQRQLKCQLLLCKSYTHCLWTECPAPHGTIAAIVKDSLPCTMAGYQGEHERLTAGKTVTQRLAKHSEGQHSTKPSYPASTLRTEAHWTAVGGRMTCAASFNVDTGIQSSGDPSARAVEGQVCPGQGCAQSLLWALHRTQRPAA